MPTDDLLWTVLPLPMLKPTHVEVLFEFVRPRDYARISCEMRFNGESYGWEVRFFERDSEFYSRRAFTLKAEAVEWAEQERAEMEGQCTPDTTDYRVSWRSSTRRKSV